MGVPVHSAIEPASTVPVWIPGPDLPVVFGAIVSAAVLLSVVAMLYLAFGMGTGPDSGEAVGDEGVNEADASGTETDRNEEAVEST